MTLMAGILITFDQDRVTTGDKESAGRVTCEVVVKSKCLALVVVANDWFYCRTGPAARPSPRDAPAELDRSGRDGCSIPLRRLCESTSRGPRLDSRGLHRTPEHQGRLLRTVQTVLNARQLWRYHLGLIRTGMCNLSSGKHIYTPTAAERRESAAD